MPRRRPTRAGRKRRNEVRLRMPTIGRAIGIFAGLVAVALGLVEGANRIGNALRVPSRMDSAEGEIQDAKKRITAVERSIDQQNAKIDALAQEVVGGRRESEKSAERLERQISGVVESIAKVSGTLDSVARTTASHGERIAQAYEAAQNAKVLADDAAKAASKIEVEQAKLSGKVNQ